MAVTNSLQARKTDSKVVEYDCGGETVKLSPAIIKQYLVNGNGAVTDQEVVMFLNLCRFQHLNPFLREAYLIKFGSQPATIVVGKEVMTKRAMRNPNFAGQQAGIVVLNKDGEIENRIGTLYLHGEEIVGGWAKVFVKGYENPVEMTVSFDEYCLKKDGKPASNWAVKPATMIRKVALVQALREAFPADLQNLYDADEMGVTAPEDGFAPIEIAEDTTEPEPPIAPQDDFFEE